MKEKVRPARKSGTSIVVSLTGFVEERKNYKIESMNIGGKDRVVLTEV
jgi:hypothetical protein